MKKVIPALLIFLLTYIGCKKDKSTSQDSVINKTSTSNPKAAVSLSANVSPDVVTAGMIVSLSGKNLPANSAAIKVYFNGIDAPVQVSLPSMVAVQVPLTKSGKITAVIGDQTLTGPTYTYVDKPTIASFSPDRITNGTVVTISGADLQVSGLTTTVSFDGVPAIIQSITPTEIKVIAPKTFSGRIIVAVTPDITAMSTAYTYTFPELLAPYISGDVSLNSQADVDAFIALNKNKQLRITGDLNIYGKDITSVAGLSNIVSIAGKVHFIDATSLTGAPFLKTLMHAGSLYFEYSGLNALSFDNLNDFTGLVFVQGMSKLTSFSFNGLKTPSNVLIYGSPLLTDASFLSNITATGTISLTNVGARLLTVDKLTTIGAVQLSDCPTITSVSMRSLKTSMGIAGVTFSQCPSLTITDFSALSTITGRLSFSETGIRNMNGFSSLTSAGALSLSGNPKLADLRGLKYLNALSLPAVTSAALGGSVNFNGILIENNNELTSLDGLQNISSLPMLRLNGNGALTDLCPMKKQILLLSALPAYTYKYTPCCDAPIGYYKEATITALILTTNGSYSTTQSVIDALSACH